ncbi:MAG: hypothetical protein COA33_005910 [Fluviicola sp.]|nr:hypothetical protein [Fluviicola sp.]
MHDFEQLLQGKLLKATINENSTVFSLNVLVPKNTNTYPVEDVPLFEPIIVEIRIHKLFIGTLENSTMKTKLEEDNIILSTFEGKVFQGDFGSPEQHNVDDIDFPSFINVQFTPSHLNTPFYELELVLPIGENMPFIKIVFNHFEVKNNNGKKLNYHNLTSALKIYYADGFVSTKDRMKWDWEILHGIKNSPEFYSNKLSNNYWFKHQFNTILGEPKIDKSFGELTLPCWIEIEENSIQYDDYGSLIDIKFINATKCKHELLENKIYVWLPSEDTFAMLTLITNELINCEVSDPFKHIINLYFSKWIPCDIINTTLVYDLKRVVKSDDKLSEHSGRELFFKNIETIIEDRNLTLV